MGQEEAGHYGIIRQPVASDEVTPSVVLDLCQYKASGVFKTVGDLSDLRFIATRRRLPSERASLYIPSVSNAFSQGSRKE